MPSDPRAVAFAVISVLVLVVVPPAVGATAATPAGSTVSDLDDPLDGATNTTDSATNTTDGTDEAIENTTDAPDSTIDTTDSTTDTIDGTTDTTADGADIIAETTDGTTDTVSNVTGSVAATAETIDGTANATFDVAAGSLDGGIATEASLSSSDGTAGPSPTERGDGDTATTASDATADGPARLESPASTGAAGADENAPADRRAPVPFPDLPTTNAAVASLAAVAAVARPPVRSAGVPALVRAGIAAHLPDRWLDKLPRFAIPLRYSRYDDSDPLAHDTRRAIYDVIDADPGIYLAELGDRTGVPLSTVRHHVDVLRREKLVCTAKPHGKRRLYPATTEDLELTAALADPATAAVLETLSDRGAAPVSELADDLDRDPSTVTHHLQRLADDGLVERERDGRAVVNHLTPAVEDALTASELDDRAPDDRKPAIADD